MYRWFYNEKKQFQNGSKTFKIAANFSPQSALNTGSSYFSWMKILLASTMKKLFSLFVFNAIL